MSRPVLAAAAAAAPGINWDAFGLVFVVALVATVVIAGSYSMGLRLLAAGGSVGARSAAVLCFAIGVAAVLFGLWLVVPQFHG